MPESNGTSSANWTGYLLVEHLAGGTRLMDHFDAADDYLAMSRIICVVGSIEAELWGPAGLVWRGPGCAAAVTNASLDVMGRTASIGSRDQLI